MNLRPYQLEAIRVLREGFRQHQRQILCLPTGAGKTVVFSEMVRMAADKGTRVLVVTDRIELFSQTLRAISRHNIVTQILDAKSKEFYPSVLVTLAMCETISRRMKKWAKDGIIYSPDLIIIDEAHKGNFFKVLDAYPKARVIGATATPKNKLFYKYYTNIVNNISIQELIDQGFLCPARSYQMQDDLSDVAIKGDEFENGSLFKHYNKSKLYDGVIREWQEKTPGTKTIVFNVNVEHAENMTAAFVAAGIPSKCVSNETPAQERTQIFAEFERGEFLVLNNCSIATTGLDIPSIVTVIMNRATLSLILFLQCIGRGSRPYSGKTHFTILDFGKNFERHGLYQQPRTWKIEKPKDKAPKQQAAPVRICPGCSAMLFASARSCEFCGLELPKLAYVTLNGVMVEVDTQTPLGITGKRLSELSIEELICCQKVGKLKASYVWRILRTKEKKSIESLGDKHERFISPYADLMKYSFGWVAKHYHEMDEEGKTGYNDFIIR